MSIASVAEGLETARMNNKELGVQIEGKLNALIRQIEDAKVAIAAEIEQRDRDLVVILDGKA